MSHAKAKVLRKRVKALYPNASKRDLVFYYKFAKRAVKNNL